MTLYGELTEDEQRLLRASLDAAGVAVSAASLGRKAETASEGFAAASFVLGRRNDYVANPLVSSVIIALEERVRDEVPFPDYVALASAPGAEEEALGILGSVVELLDRRATPDEATGYRELLMHIASAVAVAGKEDQGFLGTGGVMVNDAERAALRRIAEVLRVTPPAELPAG